MDQLKQAQIRLDDGEVIQLKFNRQDLIEIKQTHGISFMKNAGFDNVDEEIMADLIYRGAKHALNGTTPEDFFRRLPPDVEDQIVALFEAATGKEHPLRTKNDQAAAATTTE